MALPQSALSELLEPFRTGEGVNLFRESVRMVMQELIEAVLPAWVPPATTMLRPARTDASRKAAAWLVRLPSSTRSSSRDARTTNLRMLRGAVALTCADVACEPSDLLKHR